MLAFVGMMGILMVPEAGLQSQSTKSLSLFLFFHLEHRYNKITSECFEFHVQKMIPDIKAKLFSLQHECCLGLFFLFNLVTILKLCAPVGYALGLQSGDWPMFWPGSAMRRCATSDNPSLFPYEITELDQETCKLNVIFISNIIQRNTIL